MRNTNASLREDVGDLVSAANEVLAALIPRPTNTPANVLVHMRVCTFNATQRKGTAA